MQPKVMAMSEIKKMIYIAARVLPNSADTRQKLASLANKNKIHSSWKTPAYFLNLCCHKPLQIKPRQKASPK